MYKSGHLETINVIYQSATRFLFPLNEVTDKIKINWRYLFLRKQMGVDSTKHLCIPLQFNTVAFQRKVYIIKTRTLHPRCTSDEQLSCLSIINLWLGTQCCSIMWVMITCYNPLTSDDNILTFNACISNKTNLDGTQVHITCNIFDNGVVRNEN